MAWIDVTFGALIAVLACLLLFRVFSSRPKLTILIIICVALLGIAFSDHFLTPSDKPWTIFDSIYHILHKTS